MQRYLVVVAKCSDTYTPVSVTGYAHTRVYLQRLPRNVCIPTRVCVCIQLYAYAYAYRVCICIPGKPSEPSALVPGMHTRVPGYPGTHTGTNVPLIPGTIVPVTQLQLYSTPTLLLVLLVFWQRKRFVTAYPGRYLGETRVKLC